ncbi:hypothetical protein WA158_007199 [Blastocystis sp. Blastoise]
MESLPKILVCGLSQTGKTSLINGLSHYNQFKQDMIITQEKDNVKFTVYPVTLVNKYFSSEVELWCQEGNTCINETIIENFGLKNCQALFFLFNIEDPSSFEYCIRCYDSISSIHGLDAQVVIGSHIDQVPQEISDKVHSEVTNWCIDHQFEYVPANLLTPLETKDFREKEGVARVSECLDVVLWENLQKHDATTTTTSVTPLSLSPKPLEEVKVYCYNCNKIETDNKFKECQVAHWRIHKSQCISPEEKKKKEEGNMNDPFDMNSLAISLYYIYKQKFKKASQAGMSEEEKKQENDMDSFLNIMEKARRTKQEAHTLPDDERKKRAAKMTLEIMKNLGIGNQEEIEEEFNGILKDLED